MGFAVKNILIQMLESRAKISNTLSPFVAYFEGPLSLVSAYAATLHSNTEDKDKLYDDTGVLTNWIPIYEKLLLLGVFNARAGTDHNNWSDRCKHYKKKKY